MSSVGAVTAIGDWRSILADPGEREHSVQLYTNEGFLTSAVGHYAAVGLRRGEAIVLVVTPGHHVALVQRLVTDGFDVAQLTDQGQLTILDAAETLSCIMVDGTPNAEQFMPLIGGVIERAASRYARVRAYGEMVDLLWQKGELTPALQLEELWNDLAKVRPFALHCAYAIDNFDRAAHCCALHGIHHAHSQLLPVEDYSRLDIAVNRALSDVLGSTEALVLKSVLIARPQHGSRMPGAQAAHMGLSEVIPTALEAVLARARRYYGTPAGRS